jgi:hypothetical protein
MENQDMELLLGSHKIHGKPYFLRQELDGTFRIVVETSTVLQGNSYCLMNLIQSQPILESGLDIEEFIPENVEIGFLVKPGERLDFHVVRGLRHLARLENAEYVTYKFISGNCYGESVEFLDRTLVLPRFFNRKHNLKLTSQNQKLAYPTTP